MKDELKKAIKNFIISVKNYKLSHIVYDDHLIQRFTYSNSIYCVYLDEIYERRTLNSPILYHRIEVRNQKECIYSNRVDQKEFSYFLNLDKNNALEQFIQKYG